MLWKLIPVSQNDYEFSLNSYEAGNQIRYPDQREIADQRQYPESGQHLNQSQRSDPGNFIKQRQYPDLTPEITKSLESMDKIRKY